MIDIVNYLTPYSNKQSAWQILNVVWQEAE